MSATTRTAAAALAAAGLAVTGAATASAAAPDTECMRAGISTLKDAGLLSAVAKDGLPVADAVALGVTPREGTDVSALPAVLPFSTVLADHRAGDDSLFVYPWCG